MQAIHQLELDGSVTLTYNISEADAVIALHSKLKKNSQIQAVLKSQDIPVFLVKVFLHTCLPLIISKFQEPLFIVSDGWFSVLHRQTPCLKSPGHSVLLSTITWTK